MNILALAEYRLRKVFEYLSASGRVFCLFLAVSLSGCYTEEQLMEKAYAAAPEFGTSRNIEAGHGFTFEFGGKNVRYKPSKGSQIYGKAKKTRVPHLPPKQQFKIVFAEIFPSAGSFSSFAPAGMPGYGIPTGALPEKLFSPVTIINSPVVNLPNNCILVACAIAKQYAIKHQYARRAKIVSFHTKSGVGHAFALLQHKSGDWYAFDANHSFRIPHSGSNSTGEANHLSRIFTKKARPELSNVKYAFIVQES
ncbi:MAG: hypothetical protein ACK5LK_04880 [Chthoniobacterales bacterium]